MSNKAIVVFYFHGGHDGYNMLVPLDRYDRYAEYRGAIAHNRDNLIPLGIGEGNLAIHGNLPRMAGMIQSGMAAPILGTGNLFEATTRAQFEAKSVALPPFLFSHSHQQKVNKGSYHSRSGWAGRILDAWYADTPPTGFIGPAITTRNDRDLVTPESFPASIIVDEGKDWRGLTGHKYSSVSALSDDASYDHVVERVSQAVLGDALNGQAYLTELFDQFQASGKLNTAAMVASKLIAAADQMGHTRQVIHVGIPGGWDSHNNQLASLDASYSIIDNLFADFIDELEGYGVVCVTASDFGRSLTTNGRGTDHGWGSNHLVWGKPVNGAQAIGEFIDYDDPEQWTRSKRLIPKLADVQTYATLARWFGLTESEIDNIFPTLTNFGQRDLGFL